MYNIFEIKDKWDPDVHSGSVLVKSGREIITPILCGSLKDITKTLSSAAVRCTTADYEDAMTFVNKAYNCILTQEYLDCLDSDVAILYFEIENHKEVNSCVKGSDNCLVNGYAAAIESLSAVADFEYVVAAIKIELKNRLEGKNDFKVF